MDSADFDLASRRPGASPCDLSPRTFELCRAVLVLIALGMHLYWLDGRPPHFDEGVNGWFTDQMQKTGYYHYDPHNYHGPLHFYVLFLLKCLFGRHLWALRLPTALIGVLTIDWVFRFGRFFERRLCVIAAAGLTFSSGMLYYQRDAIHETWLVFFLILGMWGLYGLWQEGRLTQLWAVGLALAGMILTKETYLIHLGCLAAAVPCLLLAESLQASRQTFLPDPEPAPLAAGESAAPAGLWTGELERRWWTPLLAKAAPQLWRPLDAWIVAAVAVALVVFFYSGNFLNWHGLEGLVTAYKFWGQKAQEGEGHNKVFSYWCKLFVRNEPLACFGVLACCRYAIPAIPLAGRTWQRWVGVVVVVASVTGWALLIPGLGLNVFTEGTQNDFRCWLLPLGGLGLGTACLGLPAPSDWRLRLLAIVGPGTLVAYSIIPYKTPWCIISLLWPFFFIAGAALAELADVGTTNARTQPVLFGRWLAWAVALGLLAPGCWQLYQLNYVDPSDERLNIPDVERKDYVYVQTYNDVWKIVDPMLALANRDPTAYELPGVIICGSTYPLPWMLGDFDHIGYYDGGKNFPPTAAVTQADFLLINSDLVDRVEPMLNEPYYVEAVRLRSALEPLTLYLRAARFRPVMDPNRPPEFEPTPAAPAAPATPDGSMDPEQGAPEPRETRPPS